MARFEDGFGGDGWPRVSPGYRNPSLKGLVNQDSDVVCEHLAKEFVNLGNRVTRGNRLPELLLNRGERRFDVSAEIMGWRLVRDLRLWDVVLVMGKVSPTEATLANPEIFRGPSHRRTELHELLSAGGGISTLIRRLASGGVDEAELTLPWPKRAGQEMRLEAWIASVGPPRLIFLGRPLQETTLQEAKV